MNIFGLIIVLVLCTPIKVLVPPLKVDSIQLLNFERKQLISYIQRNSKTKEVELIADSIIHVSSKYSIPKPFFAALLKIESSFNPNANSGQAIGISQINSSVWSDTLIKNNIIVSTKDLYNPHNNIDAAGYILNHYRTYCLNLKNKKQLSAYHFYTVNECMIRKYIGISYRNGKPTNTSIEYYNKFRLALADYYVGEY